MQLSLKPAEHSALVLQILADDRPRTPREISKPNNLNPDSTRKILLELVRAGHAVRHGEIGSYRYQIVRSQGKVA